MRALLFCAALAFAACDSAGPAPVTPGEALPITPGEAPPITPGEAPPTTPTGTPEPGLQSFRFSGFPTSITVDVPDTRVIALAPYTSRALPQDFSATTQVTPQGSSADENASVLATSSLSVRALREGTSVVNMRVAAPGYRDTTLTFTVVSRVQCPPAAPAGSVDYIPSLDAGTVLTYTYRGSTDTRQGSSSIAGRILGEITGVAFCYRGTRSVPIVYTFTRTSSGPAWTFQATAAVVEDSTGLVSYPLLAVNNGGGTRRVTLQRYGVPGSAPVRLASVSVLNCSTTFRFEAGVGLTEDSMPFCYHGSGWGENWLLRRTTTP